ncbi:50S ribosomal protein L11 methyltransferase [Thermodesulforhabdus norvegica]|uniref:Ribosomal protein L11 methyltransferase (PrmA) n=1 Tax=Thermodesulforhabdus norvegica TaxID=39841 RepID=A0A1I4W3A9_9BACT|nr:50S ribosomal protein L11 methyltransferase [Thermodesulforhabdus norvegica]SFN07820.1 Ribosomal protein L11 methyltransferase (PrmA) [Thermodesulforhabdus norvegica]
MCFVYECRVVGGIAGEPHHPCYRGMRVEGAYAYFFFLEEVDGYFEDWVARNGGLVFTGRYRFHPARWQRFASGCRVGSFTVITVSRAEDVPVPDGSTVFLRRGIAFGSGVHPTTRAMVTAMEELLTREKPDVAVDCGTGSGILSIIAAKMGVPRIIAVDLSRVALREARENAVINGVNDNICFVLGRDLSALKPERIDLLMMNLEWPALLGVVRGKIWSRCRTALVSGYPLSMSSVFRQLIMRAPYKRLQSFGVEGWEALLLEKSRDKPPEDNRGLKK